MVMAESIEKTNTTESAVGEKPPLFRMVNVCKRFGGVQVLDNVNLEIGDNEIVGLVGDNGAGKSTLIKTITGVHLPTSGDLYFKGEKISVHSVKKSRALGIETVYQERALADLQTIWQNMFLGREIANKLGFLNIKEQKRQSGLMMREHMGFTSKAITVDTEVEFLSGGEKQGIAISRALYFNANLIILDEPTVALSLSETQRVQEFILDIKRRGHSAIYISHSIYLLYPVCDRFIVLDRGKVAGVLHKKDVTQDELQEKMVKLVKTGVLE
jgi:simple sugar transport system ATP-binding protein